METALAFVFALIAIRLIEDGQTRPGIALCAVCAIITSVRINFSRDKDDE